MILDRDEQLICSAFSKIKVDSKNFKRKVVRDMKRDKIRTPRKVKGVFLAAAIIFTLALGGLAAYAATGLGIFERFRTDIAPPYVEFVQPVETYVIDQGIRVDVIAAQQFDGNGIVYLSAQDITGQNRLTESTRPVSVTENFLEDIYMVRSTLVHFEAETNTAYFEMEFQSYAEREDTFRLSLGTIIFYEEVTEYDFPVSLSGLTQAPMIENNYADTSGGLPQVLAPSRGEGFPGLLQQTNWISNVAINDGRLHVQIGSLPNGAPDTLILTAPDGSICYGEALTHIRTDEDFQIIHRPTGLEADFDSQMMEYERKRQTGFEFLETVFPIDVNALESYSLTVTSYFSNAVSGDWTIEVYTGDITEHVRVFEGTFPVGDYVVESLIVSPIGVRFTMTGIDTNNIFALIGNSINVETAAGNINTQLMNWSGRFTDDDIMRVEGFLSATTPIDVSTVTAVIIDGVRIPI